MERHFDVELDRLRDNIRQMGVLVLKSISGSIDALRSLDADLAYKVITQDIVVDQEELKIDEQCLELLALMQPMACDLRFITMAMKVTTDLERMADLAVDIARCVLDVADKNELKLIPELIELAQMASCMSEDALNSFLENEPDFAGKVILLDKASYQLYKSLQEKLVKGYISKDKDSLSRTLPPLLIARYLERICNHAANIAEDVIYMVKAKVVKHSRP